MSVQGGENEINSGSHGAQGSGSKIGGGAYGSVDDQQDNWVTTEGYFENGKIIAKIPKLDNFDPEQLQYSIDVALNG